MRNNKGIAEVALLAYVIAGLVLLFVPNPVSNTLGVGIRPNKTEHTEKLVPVQINGKEVMFKTVTTDNDIQQHITFWEWLRSLPLFVLFLMGLGIIFPPISLFLSNLYRSLKNETKKIVVGVDKALDKVNDPATKQIIYDEMDKVQDSSTKNLVDKIQGKK